MLDFNNTQREMDGRVVIQSAINQKDVAAKLFAKERKRLAMQKYFGITCLLRDLDDFKSDVL